MFLNVWMWNRNANSLFVILFPSEIHLKLYFAKNNSILCAISVKILLKGASMHQAFINEISMKAIISGNEAKIGDSITIKNSAEKRIV